MDKLEKVKKLQEEIKNDNVSVSNFNKYSHSPRQTYYNLKNDAVNPEKMTITTIDDLAELYSILFPSERETRGVKWGRILAVLDTINPIQEEMWLRFSKKPMSTYKVLFERYLQQYPKQMIDYEEYRSMLVSRLTIEEFSDEPLDGLYIMAYDKEQLRLSKLAKNTRK